jgi:hypothetical protein
MNSKKNAFLQISIFSGVKINDPFDEFLKYMFFLYDRLVTNNSKY